MLTFAFSICTILWLCNLTYTSYPISISKAMLSYVPKPASRRKQASTGLWIFSVLTLEPFQPFPQRFFLLEVLSTQQVLRLAQFFHGKLHCFLATYRVALKNPDALGIRLCTQLCSVSCLAFCAVAKAARWLSNRFSAGSRLWIKASSRFSSNSVRRLGCCPLRFSAASTIASACVQETVSPA